MKRFLIPLILIFLLFLSGGYWWKENTKPVLAGAASKRFVIPKGFSASQIGNKLEKEGLIRNSLAFKIYVQITGKAKKIQAGEFFLSPSFSLTETVDKLTQGPYEVWVTIPEGLRREEIVERFIVGLGKEENEAIEFRKEFLQVSEKKEGFLFPDTYLFPRTASASAVIAKMTSTFNSKTAPLTDERTMFNGLSLNEVITLASIVERETITNEERPIVAGILLKRLKANWPLQADAAVQYAVASRNCKNQMTNCEWWPILTREDLEINSPYNTYKFTGLPPFPIANPGLSSIKAAIFPEESPYWYYIHGKEGRIYYAKTLQEHNANIRKYLGK